MGQTRNLRFKYQTSNPIQKKTKQLFIEGDSGYQDETNKKRNRAYHAKWSCVDLWLLIPTTNNKQYAYIIRWWSRMLRDGKLTKLKEASSLSFFSSSCFPPSKKKSPAALYPPPQSTCLCLSPQATTCSPIHPSTSMTFSTTSVPAIPHRHTSRATPFCLGRSLPLLKKMGSFSLFPRAMQCPLVSKS